MEEDNALDILRWLFKDGAATALTDHAGPVKLERNARLLDCEARLRGNLFGVRPNPSASCGASTEPLLVVCEKVLVERCDGQPNAFRIKYGNEELVMVCPGGKGDEGEKAADQWVLRLSMASHRIVQAEYDQALYSHLTPSNESPAKADQTEQQREEEKASQLLRNYFLTSPFTREQSFSIFRSAATPNRKIVCREVMYESKLSMVVPVEMVKLFLKWATQLRDDLLGNLWGVRNAIMVEALHTAVRHLNSNIDTYTQASEFLAGYAAGYFRPTVEKYRVAFAPVPTNLHVQLFHIDGREPAAACCLTTGAIAALPLRFTNGGLYRIRNKFNAGLDPSALDHTDEGRFHRRRATLGAIKRQIGELSRRLDVEWHVAEFGKVDKVGLQIYSEVKQIHETLIDMVQTFPGVGNLVDALCEGGFAQMARGRSGGGGGSATASPDTPPPIASFSSSLAAPPLRDSLSNQLDRLDAEMVSLSSKMSVIDAVNATGGVRTAFEESARASLHSTLDALHHLAESLLLSQMLGLVLCFRKKPDCATFFHLELRYDLLLSQALTIVCTALLTMVDRRCRAADSLCEDATPPPPTASSSSSSKSSPSSPSSSSSAATALDGTNTLEVTTTANNLPSSEASAASSSPPPVLVTCFSFLSCYGSEQSMLEDTFEALTLFPATVEFRFVEAGSVVSQTCIPQIEGHRTALRVSLPVPSQVLPRIRETLQLAPGQWFRVLPVLWNLGVNHEASLGDTLGTAELETVVNRAALARMTDLVERHAATAAASKEKEAAASKTASSNVDLARQQLAELYATVAVNPGRKNVAIFARAMALTQTLGGVPVISCKSGKDRTAMAVTLEEGRVLKETCGISPQQMSEIVAALRASGVRRENCRKNVGRPLYAFSPFQLHFLPAELRPPAGSYANGLST